VEQRLAFLQRSFDLTNEQVAQLRAAARCVSSTPSIWSKRDRCLRPAARLGLNFLVDSREYLVPMAIEEASIIAAASKVHGSLHPFRMDSHPEK